MIMVDGRGQFREENIMLRMDTDRHGIINAWWSVTRRGGHGQRSFAALPSEEDGYWINDAKERDTKSIRPNMDFCITNINPGTWNRDGNV
jgi:hypothetical protein